MRTLALSLMVMLMPHPHVHADEHHHKDAHGNPDDHAGYIAKMEDPSRDEWQKPEEVLRAIGVRAGMTVCDVGAGPGYFALRASKLVGDRGRVFAIDVEPRMLEALRDRVARANAKNVTPVLALPDDPLVPPACDVALVVDTYHHFPDGVAYLQRLARALAPGGRVVNIDFHKRELPVGPPIDHKISRDQFVKDAERAGLRIVEEPTMLPYQYFVILKPR